MKQIMRLAFVGLLAIGTVAHADNGKNKRKAAKAKAKQECPAKCPKTVCDKAKCADMTGCIQMSCSKKS